MSYIKAEEILPEELIRQIQEYADGVYIYIPASREPGILGDRVRTTKRSCVSATTASAVTMQMAKAFPP